MSEEPTVFVVDDDAAVRDSLSVLISSVGLKVETFPSAATFLDAFRPERPGCILLDVRMHGMGGLELQEELAARGLHPPIIFITAHGDMPLGVRAMKGGAFDCLAKPFNDQALLDRINQAIVRDREVRQRRTEAEAVRRRLARLSPREREVLTGVVAGKTNRVIAEELGVTVKTIDAHRARVMEKMRAGSLAELVQLWITADPSAVEATSTRTGYRLPDRPGGAPP